MQEHDGRSAPTDRIDNTATQFDGREKTNYNNNNNLLGVRESDSYVIVTRTCVCVAYTEIKRIFYHAHSGVGSGGGGGGVVNDENCSADDRRARFTTTMLSVPRSRHRARNVFETGHRPPTTGSCVRRFCNSAFEPDTVDRDSVESCRVPVSRTQKKTRSNSQPKKYNKCVEFEIKIFALQFVL